jgi:hypothetical protein
VRVTVEDVTMLDGPSRTLAAASFTVSTAGAEHELGPFELDADLPPGGGDHAVRVHVDRSGDGRVVEGDLVSVARHAVASELEVPVRRV